MSSCQRRTWIILRFIHLLPQAGDNQDRIEGKARTDIDDLITNTLGTFLGYYIGKTFSFKLPLKISADTKDISGKYEPVMILTITFLIGFFLTPLVSNKIWDIVLSGPLWENIK